MYILGINSAYHEPAACLTQNGEIIAAVEEERFNRVKHGKPALVDNPHELPFLSIDYCLREAEIEMKDVDHFAFSFDPAKRLEKNKDLEDNVIEGDWGSNSGEQKFYNLLMSIPDLLKERYHVNIKDRFHWVLHHISHAASAFYPSPFEESAILSTDGIGEFSSTMLAYGKGNELKVIEETGDYPDSLGFLWTKASRFLDLGVKVNNVKYGEYGAGKIMALAAYGNPDRLYGAFRSFVDYDDKGNLTIDGKIQQFRVETHENYEELFAFKAREENEPITQDHMDFAAALQKITNEIILGWANYLHEITGSKNLCRAGGVALNCVANSYLLEHGPFDNIFIQPGATDMGTAVGAALYIYHQFLGNKKRTIMTTPYLSHEYSNREVGDMLEEVEGIEYKKIDNIDKVAAHLLANGAVIGWFQGRMEFGPRALGNRSILADPRKNSILKRVSQGIKKREWFRPLAPSVLEEFVNEWFIRLKGGTKSDEYMLLSYELRPEKTGLVPAVTHYDNNARIQSICKETNPKFYSLIENFYKLTGIPMVVNTSFNVIEPIVENPGHAIDIFMKSGKEGIDFLAIGDYLVVRKGEYDLELITRLGLSLKTMSEHLR